MCPLDLPQEENENAKNHGTGVHAPDHINGQEAKETIDDPSYHAEDIGGKMCYLLFPLANCKNKKHLHQIWLYHLQT